MCTHEGPCKSDPVIFGSGLAAVEFRLIGTSDTAATLRITQGRRTWEMGAGKGVVDAFALYLESSAPESVWVVNAVRRQLSEVMCTFAMAEMTVAGAHQNPPPSSRLNPPEPPTF